MPTSKIKIASKRTARAPKKVARAVLTKADAIARVLQRGWANREEWALLYGKGEMPNADAELTKLRLDCFPGCGAENIWVISLDSQHVLLANQALHFMPHCSHGCVVTLAAGTGADLDKTMADLARIQDEYKAYWKVKD